MGRFDTLHLFSGALLPFWTRLYQLSELTPERKKEYINYNTGEVRPYNLPLEIIRVVADGNQPIVGVKAINNSEMKMIRDHLVFTGSEDDPLLRARGQNYQKSTTGFKKHRTMY